MIDPTINLTSIVTILAIAVGIIITWATLKNNVVSITSEIVDLKKEMKKMGEVLTSVAVQNERLNSMDERMLSQGHRIDELRASVTRVEGLRYDETQDRFNRLMTTLEKQ